MQCKLKHIKNNAQSVVLVKGLCSKHKPFRCNKKLVTTDIDAVCFIVNNPIQFKHCRSFVSKRAYKELSSDELLQIGIYNCDVVWHLK